MTMSAITISPPKPPRDPGEDEVAEEQSASVNGLQPRYLRERRKMQGAETAQAVPPSPPILWHPGPDATPLDEVTPELRRRILEAEPEPKRFSPAVALLIALAGAVLLWLALGGPAAVGRALDAM
jgi:hypothetical protein